MSEPIYFLREWWTVDEVEAFCRSSYRVFDRLPPVVRVAINAGDAYVDPSEAARLVQEHGAIRAAELMMQQHRAMPDE
jgi:hypothetical protein